MESKESSNISHILSTESDRYLKMDSKTETKTIFIGLDFDCTLTQFHYYWTYNWIDSDKRYMVNDSRLKSQYKSKVNNLLKLGNFKDLHHLMSSKDTQLNTELKHTFVKILFGSEFEKVVKLLYSIKTGLNEKHHIDIDYYIVSLGRIETLYLLFNAMRGMNGYYSIFPNLIKSIFVTNSPVSNFTEVLGHCYYDNRFNRLGCLNNGDGKSGFLTKLFNEQYNYGFMIDDTSLVDDQNIFKNRYTYIQPGNPKIDTYLTDLKNDGGRYLLKTIKHVLIPEIEKLL